MKKIVLGTIVLLSIITLIGCTKQSEFIDGDFIQSIALNKSRYLPGESVGIQIDFTDEMDYEDVEMVLRFYHLNQLIDSITLEVTTDQPEYMWDAPNLDNTGYLLQTSLYQSEKLIDTETTGIDVSSDWTFNPRYGFLSSYNNLEDEDINQIITELNSYHISGVQFYDWQYKHHLPYDSSLDTWYDIANKTVEASVIDAYITALHDRNMMAMNYNLIFGAYDDYVEDGVKDEWGLYKDQSHTTLDYHPLPSTWATSKLYIMNPNNPDWREYISDNEKNVFTRFAFDGWHMDQLGARGYTFTYGGSRVDLENSYSSFINAMHDEIQTRVLFNLVNNYGMLDVLPNENIDFVYAEIWDNNTYNELGNMIKLYRNISGKSVVLAAYMNYDSSNKKGYFNTPAVLLTDAAIFSFGATHIELGDHGMLGNEYFPNQNLQMTDELKDLLQNYYDFQVSYQNLLVDNIQYSDNDVSIDGYDTSNNGRSDTVWYHSTSTEEFQMLHLINLLDNQNDWRDNLGVKNTPQELRNFTLKYYIDDDIKNVYLASPDYFGGMMRPIDFNLKNDNQGSYVEIQVEYLQYWDMIIMEK